MNWTGAAIVGAGLVVMLGVKRLGLVSGRKARALLDRGATVIDVRTPGEYAAGHLPRTINIPLDQLDEEIARHAPAKDQPLLLHCLSGTRSGFGRRLLRQLGYSDVHNLGSYGRARRLLGTDKTPSDRGR